MRVHLLPQRQQKRLMRPQRRSRSQSKRATALPKMASQPPVIYCMTSICCANGAGVQPAASGGGHCSGKIPRRAIRQTADRPPGDVPGNQKSVGGRRADRRTGGGCSWRLTHNFFQMGSQRRGIGLSRRSEARVKISMLIFSPETLAIFHQSWYNEASK